MSADDFHREVQSVMKKYTEGVYRMTITYIDINLEFHTFETDAVDLKNVLNKLVTEANILIP
jgi:hypothetical protein